MKPSRKQNRLYWLFNRWMPSFRIHLGIPRLFAVAGGLPGFWELPDEREMFYAYLQVLKFEFKLVGVTSERPGFRPWLRGWLLLGKKLTYSFDRMMFDVSDPKNPMMRFCAEKLVLTKNRKPIRDLWVINKCEYRMEDPIGFDCELNNDGCIVPPS